jgi:hypothetical protein
MYTANFYPVCKNYLNCSPNSKSKKRYLLGQFWMLQLLVIDLEPGQLPPLASVIVFDRDRDWVPPPQVFEHEE